MVRRMAPFSGPLSKREVAGQAKPTTARVQIHGEWFEVVLCDVEQEKFWKTISIWEPSTLSFVGYYARPGVTFVDVGAWIGPITLLAARRGARVISLEPDPVAFSALRQNLLLNGLTAELICAAIHTDENGLVLHEGRNGFGDSMSSSLKYTTGQEIAVPTITASHLMRKIHTGQKEVVFKVDIEGHEYVVGGSISDVRRTLLNSGTRVALHLSVHPRLLRKSFRRKSFRFSRTIVRGDTRRLLETFDCDGNLFCENGVPLSARAITSRFVPSWPRVVRNFSVMLTN